VTVGTAAGPRPAEAAGRDGDRVLPISGCPEDGPRVRAFVRDLGRCGGLDEEAVDRAVQLTAEFFGHQVSLGRKPSAVRCLTAGGALRVRLDVDCCDEDVCSPQPQESRRRLLLVDSLADRWGVDSDGTRSTWWFVVA
jgi:alkanesulfonate monooxygenase SsuD/methylene tetrahydromethanopterin reductase-like flavin-dependent oxidoreductase (luciferase family)